MVEVVRYWLNLKECSIVIYQFLQGFHCKKAVSRENLKTGLITQVFSISSMTQFFNDQFTVLITPHDADQDTSYFKMSFLSTDHFGLIVVTLIA